MKIVTISTAKGTGDRSYSHGLYAVHSENETHIRVFPLREKASYWKRLHTLEKAQYDFTAAEDLASKEELKEALSIKTL